MKTSKRMSGSTLASILVLGLFLMATPLPMFGQASPCGPMDVVFVVDTTGSMGGTLTSVKNDLGNLVELINRVAGGDFRLGLLEFKDEVFVLNDIAGGNTAEVVTNILALSPGGGAGEPEAGDEALNTVINGLKATDRPEGKQVGNFAGSFRSNAARVVIHVTDARPAGFDDSYDLGVDDVQWTGIARTAEKRDIRISAVQVPSPFGEEIELQIDALMKNLANLTGGRYVKTDANGVGAAQALSEIIVTCGGATFFVEVEPSGAVLGGGGEATFDVKTTHFGKFSSDLTLSATGLPDDATVTFSPAVIPAPGSGKSVMTFKPGPNTFPGTYFLTVVATSTDGQIARTSTVKVEIECRPPFIFGLPQNQPQSQTVASGGRATLKVVPGGSGPFRYQWYMGPAGSELNPIAGATADTFITPALTRTTDFWVRVWNVCGNYDSFAATVSVSGQAPTTAPTRTLRRR